METVLSAVQVVVDLEQEAPPKVQSFLRFDQGATDLHVGRDRHPLIGLPDSPTPRVSAVDFEVIGSGEATTWCDLMSDQITGIEQVRVLCVPEDDSRSCDDNFACVRLFVLNAKGEVSNGFFDAFWGEADPQVDEVIGHFGSRGGVLEAFFLMANLRERRLVVGEKTIIFEPSEKTPPFTVKVVKTATHAATAE